MRIVVTGASGFIGGALVRALRARGDEVYAGRPPAPRAGRGRHRPRPATPRHLACSGREPRGHRRRRPSGRRPDHGPLEPEAPGGDPLEPDRLRQPARPLPRLAREPAGGARLRLGRRHLRRSRGRGARRDERPGHRACSPICAAPGRRAPRRRPSAASASSRSAPASSSAAPEAPTAAILAPRLPIFRLGLGARLGDGRQWTSWIALDDEVAALMRAPSTTPACPGRSTPPLPNPVRNAELTDAIAAVLGRRSAARRPRPTSCASASAAAPPTSCSSPARGCCRAKLTDAGFVHAYGDLHAVAAGPTAPCG